MAALIFSILLGMGWLMPDHFPPWWAFLNEAPVFLGLLLAMGTTCLIALRQRRHVAFRLGEMPTLVLLLMLLAVAQYFTGKLPFAGDLWVTLIYLGGFALAWMLGAIWADEPIAAGRDPLETVAWAFALGAVLSALMGLVQWLELEGDWAPWVMLAAHSTRALANLAQPNQLSTLLLMGIVAAAILREREKIGTGLLVLMVTVQSLGVVLTQSRTGLLVVAVLALWYLWAGVGFSHIRRHAVMIWAASIWLLELVLSQGMGQAIGKQGLGEQIVQAGSRPLMWRQFLEAIGQSPWWGYGWLQTQAAQQDAALKVPGFEQAFYAHNIGLDLAIWIGVPLTVLVVMTIVMVIWRRRSFYRDKRVIMVLTWVLPVGCHAMLEFPLAYAYFLLPVGVLLGMLDQWTQKDRSWSLKLPGWGAAFGCFLYGGLLLGVGLEYMQAEEDYRVARFEQRRIGKTADTYEVPNLRLLTQLGTVLQGIRLRAVPGMTPSDIELLKEGARRYPWLPLHFQYAVALGLNNQPTRATQQLEVMRGLFGERLYQEIRKEYLNLQEGRYPQMREVHVP